MARVIGERFTNRSGWAKKAPDLESIPHFSLLAAGQRGLEVVVVGVCVRWLDQKNTLPKARERRSPGCPSLRVCRHTWVAAVLFYVTNCLGSARWQAAEG